MGHSHLSTTRWFTEFERSGEWGKARPALSLQWGFAMACIAAGIRALFSLQSVGLGLA